MIITLEQIPSDENSSKTILIDGKRAGVVTKGWLRLGGNQWVILMTGRPPCGCKTLGDVIARIEYIAGRMT